MFFQNEIKVLMSQRSNHPLTEVLLNRFSITESARKPLLEYETQFYISLESGRELNDDQWRLEAIKLRLLCQYHKGHPNAKTFDPLGNFDHFFERWRAIVCSRYQLQKITSKSLPLALAANLNLQPHALRMLEVELGIWKNQVLEGVELSMLIENIQKQCRQLSGKGFYDPNRLSTKIITAWYHSVLDEYADSVVTSVIQVCLEESKHSGIRV